MEWMSPMDASFLHIEGPNNPMHIGGVSIFEGPAPPFERLEEMVVGQARRCPPLPAEGPLRPARIWVAPCGWTTRTSTSPTTSGTAPCPAPGQRRDPAPDGGPDLCPAPGSPQAAVGDLDGRGAEREPLGAAVEGPPLHGRRRLGHRPDDGDVRRRRRRPSAAATGSRLPSRATPSCFCARSPARRSTRPSSSAVVRAAAAPAASDASPRAGTSSARLPRPAGCCDRSGARR